MTATIPPFLNADQRVVFVTGPSGAGRSTAIRVLEDLGYEVIDNLPLSLMSRVLGDRPLEMPLALGIDVRNREFSTYDLIAEIERLEERPNHAVQLLYLDATEDVLVRRYSETRRRHPLAPANAPVDGIQRERELLVPLRNRADVLIDTTTLSPHDLKAEIEGWFRITGTSGFGLTVQSFSYKRGLPRGLDIVLDCRFLRNPYWDEGLRGKNGQDPEVDAYVASDERFDAFFNQTFMLISTLLPAYREEGKSHLSIGFGCTGGQHRSVMMTERLSNALAEKGWRVSKRHRELERSAHAKGAGS